MRDLDETDFEILRLLLDDARRPYSDLAEAVDLSPPAVSDRVARLRDVGVIRRFTLDVDRTQLHGGTPVLVDLEVDRATTAVSAVRQALLDSGSVEHVFTTAESHLVFQARVPDSDFAAWLFDVVDEAAIGSYDVTLLSGVDWSPDLGGTEFGLTCVQCGNTVDTEGVSTRIDGDLYQFCCPSCETRFREKYAELKEGAG
ncbi:AsnC family transcriptional regulator [Salinigranum marinum]|uniref:AsnC family transcriptional regulator n=1 Tax=Salinigranum marinum TaxID=1515595 RepID=UPI002989CFCB|nr:AsnC family transcriptional regulator [Salinigranum marinum]